MTLPSWQFQFFAVEHTSSGTESPQCFTYATIPLQSLKDRKYETSLQF